VHHGGEIGEADFETGGACSDATHDGTHNEDDNEDEDEVGDEAGETDIGRRCRDGATHGRAMRERIHENDCDNEARVREGQLGLDCESGGAGRQARGARLRSRRAATRTRQHEHERQQVEQDKRDRARGLAQAEARAGEPEPGERDEVAASREAGLGDQVRPGEAMRRRGEIRNEHGVYEASTKQSGDAKKTNIGDSFDATAITRCTTRRGCATRTTDSRRTRGKPDLATPRGDIGDDDSAIENEMIEDERIFFLGARMCFLFVY
jgi:hypothetical protein